MQIVDDLTKASLQKETVLTIGAFDGVHRGHQALIGAVVARARATDRLAALITFHPHPVMVLAPERAPHFLTTPGEKMALVEGLGIDLVVLLPFNRQVAALSARDFMAKVSKRLQLRELWVGADFALGRNREGDVPRLRELAQDLGYEVRIFEPLALEGDVISSSRIRDLLKAGQVQEVAELLGRYPSLSGEVVPGAQRGHGLGFPTANLEIRPERAVPADGVYAVFAVLGTERFPAVANIGVRPTFDNGQRTVETHIFDFDRDLYGCDLVIEFVARLRDERRFEHVNDLLAQIEQDSQAAHQILSRELKETGRIEAISDVCRYRYHEVEHTADRALRVWGQALPDLFVGAARGMYSLMGDVDGLVATSWHTVQLEAWDLETLLVEWLNELLYLTEMEGLLCVDCRIESLRGSTGSVASSGPGVPENSLPSDTAVAALRAQVGTAVAPLTRAHIKAATFHNLALVQGETGWSTLITFDV
jgi:riboflavin kinase/FMN adenylyltransferase